MRRETPSRTRASFMTRTNRMVAALGWPLGTVQTYEYAPDNRGWWSGRGTGAATVTLANRVGAGGHGGVTSRSQGRGLWHI
jgi:hypothetical protein